MGGALCGGIALYLLALSAIRWATPSSLGGCVLAARLVVAVALGLAPLGAYLGPLALVGLLALVLVGLTAFEHRIYRDPAWRQGPPIG